TATYAGFVNGEDASDLDGTLTLFSPANQLSHVGSHQIFSFGQSSSNYTITHVPGTLMVTPAPLAITADDQSKVYGQAFTFPADAFTGPGLLNADEVTDLSRASAGAPATANVGDYAIVRSNAQGTGILNYTISYADGTMTVTPAPLTITADDQS